ncbi:putative ATP phosphoribosyltransferase [Triangularia verruculosa]|uniref:ATP phosphoribosyltransferase n=1 Tax=Triangularia verruculosa TaxID=2587418 RepID=A0AAN6XC30_9PEZI|nr:putative ATP phosphoribosyltransferase [Triangularia verruculosa]
MDLVNSLEGRLLFAVPKKGRLLSAALNLLEGADIQFKRENRLDIALVKNLPIALVFLPAADIPTFVGEGRVDLGITGYDQVQEHDAGVRALARARRMSNEWSADKDSDKKPRGCDTIMDLGFGACKLQVQVPAKGEYQTGRDLVGKNIGTSFVHLAAEYFARLELEQEGIKIDSTASYAGRKLRTKIIELSGSVEAACALGVADGIVDLVESGETMKAAGLKAIDTVVETSAILIKSKAPSNPAMVDLIAARINGVITAQKYVLCQYNVPRDRLADATKVTPGKRAPTVTSLEEDGWVAVSAMVEKKRIAPVMDDLAKVGATDILVLDIHNTRGS